MSTDEDRAQGGEVSRRSEETEGKIPWRRSERIVSGRLMIANVKNENLRKTLALYLLILRNNDQATT